MHKKIGWELESCPAAEDVKWIAGYRELRGGEVLPDLAGGLHLEDAALIRVKEIISLRNAVGVGGLDRAAGPSRRTNAAAVLLELSHELKSVIHTVLDSGGSSGY